MTMTNYEQLLLKLDDTDNIIWKPAIVPNNRKELYEGLYECSNIGGMIRDAKTKRILRMFPDKENYYRLRLKDKNGVYHTESGHRIIAATFCTNPNPEEYTDVNHKDGNPMNNDASNLEWVDKKLNEQHKHKVLKPNLLRFVLIFAIKDNERRVFKSVKEAALALGVSTRKIQAGLNRSVIQHKTKGYELIGFRLNELNELKDIISGRIPRPEILDGFNLEDYI